MCGIAGWVDYDRDLRTVRDVAQAMTDTMVCRGPDAEGLRVEPHAALGHRRLAIIDIEGGRQPMAAERDGRLLAVLTYSGEVYNFRELRAELAARGHHFRTESDTEVVLEAYLEWGEDFVGRLNGMYAFAIWDARREELLLVRDRMGIKPLYYYPTPSGVLFGSEPKAILANPLAERVVDADGLRELLAFVKTPERAIYRGMYEVRPGQLVRIRREGVTRRRYWTLESREHTDDLPTTIENVRGLLDDIVSRQLISDVPLCSLLSGGLDSSAVTALAARALGTTKVRSFSVDFAGYTENFQPDEMRDTPDGPYVKDVVKHIGADHTDILLNSADLMDPAVRAAVLRARDLPAGIGDMDTSLYLLFKAIRGHSTVALSGESADEVFGGYKWFHDAEAVNSGTFPWLAMRGSIGRRGLDGLFDEELTRKLDIPAYRADAYQQALAEVKPLPGETGLQKRMREVSYLHLTRFVQILLDRKDRMSMAVGLEVRVPFCDHRLVEYVYNAPWAMKTFDGREKSLLRAATADVLPRSVVERRKSPYPSTQDPAYERALQAEAVRLLGLDDLPVAPLLDMAKARTALDHEVGTTSLQESRAAMEQLIQFNAWLERYGVRVTI
ncbi:asparagine synthase (glutamine-hydrolyzing) [Microtetraspora sp. AC03309]|uniref:asparagine synthase (glutamine-hydrolyzing) n=1 Tax=Microtetraspora sp. AC03309 TaxID=2779376 RepID=UPI001E59BB9E|nr:asparagine synthase (glutamine-hydrolyzing) [Microtetraspora sp. AC03309]MCC5578150.1 asparagine synthase (glutamine-hydrolyzing) [Microtetraspora sp. AC03309]